MTVRTSPSRTERHATDAPAGQWAALRPLGRAARIERHEVRLAGHVDEVLRERRRTAEEPRGVGELLEDVARVARPQPEIFPAVVREDLRQRLRAVLDLLSRARALEDLLV